MGNPLRRLYEIFPLQMRLRLRRLIPPALRRWYAHYHTDVYLISYPKCGRTWLRLMIGRAISRYFRLPSDEEILFLRTNRRFHPAVPRIRVIHEDRPMLKPPQELNRDKSHFRSKKVIFLVRDPRDVIVSSYFESRNRSRLFAPNPYEKPSLPFEGSLHEFIHRSAGGFDTLLTYYNIWAQNRSRPAAFLLVRYEDLKADPHAQLRRVLDFLGLQGIPDEIIEEAIQFASFENMRRMEAEGRFSSPLLQPADKSDQETYKTRKGKIHGFRDYLNHEEIEALNKKMKDQLDPFFGYTP